MGLTQYPEGLQLHTLRNPRMHLGKGTCAHPASSFSPGTLHSLFWDVFSRQEHHLSFLSSYDMAHGLPKDFQFPQTGRSHFIGWHGQGLLSATAMFTSAPVASPVSDGHITHSGEYCLLRGCQDSSEGNGHWQPALKDHPKCWKTHQCQQWYLLHRKMWCWVELNFWCCGDFFFLMEFPKIF